MCSEPQKRRRVPSALVVITAILVPRLIYLKLLPIKALSHDLYAWLKVAGVLADGGNPYAETHLINYPPFWLQFVFLFTQIDLRFGIAFVLQVRLFLIACECLIACLVLVLARKHLNVKRPAAWVIGVICVNPICILLSVQHGNFDVLLGLWVLLFAWCLLDFHCSDSPGKADTWLLACLFLGIGILTKTVPFVLVPLLFYRSRRLSATTRLLGLILTFAPVILGMSVIFALAPKPVFEHVVCYRSIPGFFGFSGLFGMAGFDALNELYARVFPLLMIAALVWLGRWFSQLRAELSKQDLLLVCALILVAVPLFGPGYSPQYIYWFLPLLLLLAMREDFGWRPTLCALLVLAIPTYLAEYALLGSHGAFLIRWLELESFRPLSDALGRPAGQPLLRLPLFAGYLAFFIRGCRVLAKGTSRAE